jgi:hypothetical protein
MWACTPSSKITNDEVSASPKAPLLLLADDLQYVIDHTFDSECIPTARWLTADLHAIKRTAAYILSKYPDRCFLYFGKFQAMSSPSITALTAQSMTLAV